MVIEGTTEPTRDKWGRALGRSCRGVKCSLWRPRLRGRGSIFQKKMDLPGSACRAGFSPFIPEACAMCRGGAGL